MDEYAIGVLTNIGLLSFVALSAYLLLVAGELSFGQQAFFGVGAYAAGIGTAMLGWPLPLSHLQYWIRGLPVPGSAPAELERDEAKRLSAFTQNNWRVALTYYDEGDFAGKVRRGCGVSGSGGCDLQAGHS